jgi:hypothetical protein
MSIRPDPLLWMLLAACVAMTAAPARVLAQDPDSARAVPRRDGLCPDAQVQISTTFAERFRGRCVLQDARLLVVRDGIEQPVLYTAVDSIWVRGPATRSGTITGAWLGAGLGAAWVGVFCDYRCRDDLVEHGIGGLAGGALGGALLGRSLGSEAQVWIRLYPHP